MLIGIVTCKTHILLASRKGVAINEKSHFQPSLKTFSRSRFCTREIFFASNYSAKRKREKKRLIKCFPRTVSLTKMGKKKKTRVKKEGERGEILSIA